MSANKCIYEYALFWTVTGPTSWSRCGRLWIVNAFRTEMPIGKFSFSAWMWWWRQWRRRRRWTKPKSKWIDWLPAITVNGYFLNWKMGLSNDLENVVWVCAHAFIKSDTRNFRNQLWSADGSSCQHSFICCLLSQLYRLLAERSCKGKCHLSDLNL